jgi:dihydrolipoamide dehydrogenase
LGKRIIVIGGGPGGYAAAIKAAQLGAEVILAEAADIGGTCLNVGCIPTKSLLHTAGQYRRIASNAVPGIKTTGAELDWAAAQSHKDAVVRKLAGGVGILLRRNGVTVRKEKAIPLSGNSAMIGAETIDADAVLLATGSINTQLDFPGASLPGVIDSTAALGLERVPESMAIVGGGVIGLEFAALYGALGTKITVIELAGRLLPSMDAEISEYIKAALSSEGAAIHTGAQLTRAESAPDGLTISFEEDGESWIAKAEALLVAAGRSPNTAGLGLEGIGVRMSHGAIDTDEFFRTNVPGLYAVGDCNGRLMLAHAAMAQGETAAGHIMGAPSRIAHKVVPACVYTSPEIASVGLTEEQAKASGLDYTTGRFDMSGNAKAAIEGAGGFVKIIADRAFGEVLGVHIVGPGATELIAEAALCINIEGTVEDIVNTIHAHPTASESTREAAMSVFGKPIHGLAKP